MDKGRIQVGLHLSDEAKRLLDLLVKDESHKLMVSLSRDGFIERWIRQEATIRGIVVPNGKSKRVGNGQAA